MLLFISNICFCDSDKTSAYTFQKGFFTFIVEPGVNVGKFANKISLRKIPSMDVFNKSGGVEDENELGWKFSVVFNRVKRLLNMFPKKVTTIYVHIFNDTDEMQKILKSHSKHSAPAFYNTNDNTVYVSSKKCDEYILAHELAHAIIATYYIVKTPENVQEILAIYCDQHLKDQSL
ncbi:MAG: hypothetical protein ACD_79C01216G0001 [uncultured bacterium]|nr:MAG: hypothetical protein ACD_79C01216G0001 [uncultured bacterium]